MKRYYFREHRGGLVESLVTKREIPSLHALENVEIRFYTYDDRLNVSTYIVLQDGCPIGFITEEEEE